MQNVNNKKFPILKILIVQAVVAALILGILLFIKKSSPAEYEKLSKQYVDIVGNDFSDSKTKETWSKIKAFFVDDNNKLSTKNKGAGGKDEDANGNVYPDNCSASKYIISSDIAEVAKGRISSPFGYRINPVTEKLSFHTGVDIANREGTAVKSAYYGLVESVGEDDVYGNYIYINHGNGIKTFYAHLSKVSVSAGDVVSSGKVIGKMGSTGWSTGPHLHFSIIIDDIYYNPSFVLDNET